ncbi:GGDEF domain-containing protein [Dehalobacter sp. DCM]|uniref:GGDEF domain-containing protein n=1 Tax=Dehalobacter sp. DCM TaxID=2907827 RepID=UPI0030815B20|nr:GGDEF domain-containing protein [Dehalobacter sp. DCM]
MRYQPLERKFLLLRWGLIVIVIIGQVSGTLIRPTALFTISSVIALFYSVFITINLYRTDKQSKKLSILTLFADIPVYTLLLAGNAELVNILFLTYLLFILLHTTKSSQRGLIIPTAESIISILVTLTLCMQIPYSWQTIALRLFLLVAGAMIIHEITILLNASQSRYIKAKAQAAEDPLTGLSNRLLLETHYNKAVQDFKKTKQPFSIALFDIDNFKIINDQKGHIYGDKVLKALARTLKANVRNNDFICRYGGEEFLIIFHACSLKDACVKADRIRDEFAYSFFDRPVTMSAGVTLYQEGSSMAENIDIADKALYAAKEAGKNRTQSSDPNRYEHKLLHKEA